MTLFGQNWVEGLALKQSLDKGLWLTNHSLTEAKWTYEHMKTWGFVSKKGVEQLLGGVLAVPATASGLAMPVTGPQVWGLQVCQEWWSA